MARQRNSLWLSILFALRGIFYCVRTQRNMKIHLGIGIAVVVLGFLFRLTAAEWLSVIIAILMVTVTETINTAIEINVDLVTKRLRPRAMMAKDVAAGAVMMAAIGAVVVGIIVFGGRMCNLAGS